MREGEDERESWMGPDTGSSDPPFHRHVMSHIAVRPVARTKLAMKVLLVRACYRMAASLMHAAAACCLSLLLAACVRMPTSL